MHSSPYIRFKTPELESQWNEGYRDENGNLNQLHPALKVLILAAAYKHFLLTGKPMVITSLYRSGRGSPHNYGRGGDGRIHDIPNPQRNWWEEWLNETFTYHGKLGCKTALIHDVGKGNHIHLQVGPKEPIPEVPETFIAA